MALQLHRVLEEFSKLFTLEGFFICMSPKALIVVPFVGIAIITLTAFIDYTTMGTFVFD